MRLTTKVIPGLHIGGSWRTNPPDKGWDAIITVCHPGEVVGTPPARHYAALAMMDAPWVEEPVVAALRDATVGYVRAGAKTLVRCHAGLNRSALVAVLAAVDITGAEPHQLVDRLRSRRSKAVLSNETFARYVLAFRTQT